jgi:hypothetical protein
MKFALADIEQRNGDKGIVTRMFSNAETWDLKPEPKVVSANSANFHELDSSCC